MPKKYPPLALAEIIEILKANSFVHDDIVGTHAQYIAIIKSVKRKVAVDMSEKDFGDALIKSMIAQSGLTREEFCCSTKATAKKINMRMPK